MASARVIAGRMVVSRRASMDLPAPGGPSKSHIMVRTPASSLVSPTPMRCRRPVPLTHFKIKTPRRGPDHDSAASNALASRKSSAPMAIGMICWATKMLLALSNLVTHLALLESTSLKLGEQELHKEPKHVPRPVRFQMRLCADMMPYSSGGAKSARWWWESPPPRAGAGRGVSAFETGNERVTSSPILLGAKHL
jgi:hypothetical protein